jgi:hypothetical protein
MSCHQRRPCDSGKAAEALLLDISSSLDLALLRESESQQDTQVMGLFLSNGAPVIIFFLLCPLRIETGRIEHAPLYLRLAE